MSEEWSFTINEYKTCTKCGQTKLRTNEFFYKSKKSPDGLRPDCADCGRARSNKWSANNRQRSRDRASKWRLENLDKKLESGARWYEKNREQIRAKFKEQYKADPEKFIAFQRTQRAKRRQAYAEKYRKEDVLQRWGSNCHICGESIDLAAPRQTMHEGWEKGLHLDHVIPLSKGGTDTLDNVKPAHGQCNIKKQARIL